MDRTNRGSEEVETRRYWGDGAREWVLDLYLPRCDIECVCTVRAWERVSIRMWSCALRRASTNETRRPVRPRAVRIHFTSELARSDTVVAGALRLASTPFDTTKKLIVMSGRGVSRGAVAMSSAKVSLWLF